MNTAQLLEDEKKRRGIVADGEKITVSMLMMDGVQRKVSTTRPVNLHDALGRPAGQRPGYVFAVPTAQMSLRDRSYEAEGERIRQAWKMSGPEISNERALDTSHCAKDARSAWEAEGARVRNAWKGDRQ